MATKEQPKTSQEPRPAPPPPPPPLTLSLSLSLAITQDRGTRGAITWPHQQLPAPPSRQANLPPIDYCMRHPGPLAARPAAPAPPPPPPPL